MNVILKPHSFFLPFATLYGGIVSFRNWLYDHAILDSYRSPLPVISVGNITVGGAGKSPFCIYLAEMLLSMGRKPVIVSRGYKGSCKGPHLVLSGDDAAMVGDEPLMHVDLLGGQCPVIVAKKRAEGIRFVEHEKLGDVVILDDGFQHRRVSRDLDILLVDVTTEQTRSTWEQGKILPAGYLREPKQKALKRIGAIVFCSKAAPISSSEYQKLKMALPHDMPSFSASYCPTTIRDVFSGERFSVEEFKNRQMVPLCALAQPEGFLSLLRQAGVSLCSAKMYPDHYGYSAEDVNRILSATEGKAVITTSKDAAKLRKFLNLPNVVFDLIVALRFCAEEHEQSFRQLCSLKIKSR